MKHAALKEGYMEKWKSSEPTSIGWNAVSIRYETKGVGTSYVRYGVG